VRVSKKPKSSVSWATPCEVGLWVSSSSRWAAGHRATWIDAVGRGFIGTLCLIPRPIAMDYRLNGNAIIHVPVRPFNPPATDQTRNSHHDGASGLSATNNPPRFTFRFKNSPSLSLYQILPILTGRLAWGLACLWFVPVGSAQMVSRPCPSAAPAHQQLWGDHRSRTTTR
jgi:hypothetical protein